MMGVVLSTGGYAMVRSWVEPDTRSVCKRALDEASASIEPATG